MVDPYWRRAHVQRVIDGDTVIFLIDLGFHIYSEHSCRILGVNSPEHYGAKAEPAGLAAMEFTKQWVAEHNHDNGRTGWPFNIRTEKSDSFGRYLAQVLCLEEHDLAVDLLRSGHATSYKPR